MKKTIAEKQNNLALLLLYGVCFVTAVSAAGFIWITTDRILSQYEAREFLGTIDRIPGDSFHVLLWVSACMVFLGMSFLLRLRLKGRGERLIFWSLLFDFIVGFCAVAVLDFNYNGILLWVFANILVYVRKNRFWPIITGVGILSYTFTGFELISIRMRVFDIADYIHVYGSSTQMYLFGVWNFLEILTLVSFIGCCLVIIVNKEEELEKTNELYAQLAVANENLKQANEELSDIMEENAKMVQVRERNRIAREIHDTMGHTLTGIAAGIDACIALSDSSPELVKQQLRVLSEVSRKGIADVRHSVNELRPDALERLNLETAIRQMVDNMQQVSGTEISFSCSVPVLKFDEDEEAVIYRVIQESITNAVRHGHASKIWIAIDRKEWDGKLHLSISDNGCGCGEIKEGFGIRHIRERIRMLNGKVSFASDGGFQVEAEIPIRWGEEYD